MAGRSAVPFHEGCFLKNRIEDPLDCLVIGGGPAGLTAAIYLGRFLLSAVVVDRGEGRLASIPKTRNHPGFPEGIAGAELLERMRTHAGEYGADLRKGEVVSLEMAGDIFLARTKRLSVRARTVLLATGVVNRRPIMPDALHDAALASGLLRYCPICDAYEVTDRPVAVLGSGSRALREAEFLRGYSSEVALIDNDIDAAGLKSMDEAGIEVLSRPHYSFDLQSDRIDVLLESGRRSFASVYVALGSDIRSELAVALGADVSDEGCIIVDAHQRTSVPGLYAAGDVVVGLDQISRAMGDASVAATAIRNDLAAQSPIRR